MNIVNRTDFFTVLAELRQKRFGADKVVVNHNKSKQVYSVTGYDKAGVLEFSDSIDLKNSKIINKVCKNQKNNLFRKFFNITPMRVIETTIKDLDCNKVSKTVVKKLLKAI